MNTAGCTRAGLFVGFVLVFGVVVAYAQDVSYNAMPGTDFSKFKTYKWVQVEGATHQFVAPECLLYSSPIGRVRFSKEIIGSLADIERPPC
jgi:hypothetical protein